MMIKSVEENFLSHRVLGPRHLVEVIPADPKLAVPVVESPAGENLILGPAKSRLARITVPQVDEVAVIRHVRTELHQALGSVSEDGQDNDGSWRQCVLPDLGV